MRFKGTFTIEASVIVPLILFVFAISVKCLFYFHDRGVLGAVAYETLVVESGVNWDDLENIENSFLEHVEGKTFLFTDFYVKVEMSEKEVFLECSTQKDGMRIQICRSISVTEPEEYIRSIRKLEKIGNKIGD